MAVILPNSQLWFPSDNAMLVQQAIGTNSTEFTFGFPADLTAGNSVIACITYDYDVLSNPFDFVQVEADNGNDALVLADQNWGGRVGAAIYYAHNIAGGGHPIFHIKGLIGNVCINVAEYAGLVNAAPTETNSDRANGTFVKAGPITPTPSNNLIASVGGWQFDLSAFSNAVGGFNELYYIDVFGALTNVSSYLFQNSATMQDPEWDLFSAYDYAAINAVFETS